jgi:signal transduction histidine kinase
MATLLIILTILGNLTIAAIVYSNNKKSATNVLLAALSINLAIWELFTYIALQPGTEMTRLFWVRFVMFITATLGPLIYLLAKVFPDEKLKLNTIQKVIVISLPALTAITALTPTMFTSLQNLPNGDFTLRPGPTIVIYAVNLFYFMIAGFITLIKKYRSSSGIRKKQLSYFLAGIVLTFSAIAVTNFIAVVAFGTIRYTYLGPALTIIMIGFIAFAMLRHRLLEIRFIVYRAVVFTLILITFAIIGAGSLLFVSQFLTEGINQIIIYTTLSIVFAFSFNPLRRLFEKATKNIFYQEAYSSEELLESLGSILRSTLSITTLTTNVLKELSDTMHITRAAFYLKNDEGEYHVRSIGYDQTPSLSNNTIHNLTSAVKNELLVFDELDESAIKMLMRQNKVAVALPLRVKSTYHGLLILEDKSSGEIYSQQDIDVLEIFAPQISVAIQNALSYDEIKHFADTLKEEVRIATTDLRAANRRLTHLDKIKNEFIFIATHELKNPVTAMRGYLSMISEGFYGKIPDKMKDPLTQIQNSNQQLVELVNDLLQIARSEAKTLTIKPETVDLCSTIDAVCGNVKSLLDQKGLKLDHNCPSEKPLVTSDPIRLKEIINNLVSNAIKYSEKGTITISHEVKNNVVITHVKDEGVGISKKDAEKLFTRFYRVEDQAAKGIPGTGLGLYIIKQITEKMGGQIWFESEVGIGSTFSFSLPQAR